MAKTFGYVVGLPSTMQTVEDTTAEKVVDENSEEVNESILSDEPES
jgi:hypothetical protein